MGGKTAETEEKGRIFFGKKKEKKRKEGRTKRQKFAMAPLERGNVFPKDKSSDEG